MISFEIATGAQREHLEQLALRTTQQAIDDMGKPRAIPTWGHIIELEDSRGILDTERYSVSQLLPTRKRIIESVIRQRQAEHSYHGEQQIQIPIEEATFSLRSVHVASRKVADYFRKHPVLLEASYERRLLDIVSRQNFERVDSKNDCAIDWSMQFLFDDPSEPVINNDMGEVRPLIIIYQNKKK